MTEKSSTPSRREFVAASLKGVAYGFSATALVSLTKSSGPAVIKTGALEQMLGQFDAPAHAYNPDQTFVYPRANQVATASNANLNNFSRSESAFAIVHSGFVSGQMAMVDKILHSKDPNMLVDKDGVYDIASGRVGSVQEHDARMARLLTAVSETYRPVMSFVDEPDLYNPHTPTKGLAPPSNAIQIATLDSSPELAPDVTFINSAGGLVKEKQDIAAMYEGLRGAGVQTIYCAGEYSFSPYSRYPACLGGVALQFMNAGFEVRGIHNAIFPAKQEADIHDQQGLAEALYNNALPYHEALQLARSVS